MTKADIDAVAMFTARVFAPTDVESVWHRLRMAYHACPFMPVELCWGLEEDGRIVAQWQLLDYTLRIGRAHLRAAGCFGIASAEDARGRHHMLTVAELGRPIPAHEGFDLLIGFAKDSRAFMQMDGVVPFGPECRWSMATADGPAQPVDGFRPAGDADLAAVCRWHNTSFPGLCNIVRTPSMWPWMLRRPPELFLNEQGYIGLRQHGDALEIREAAGSTPGFYARALAFACSVARERNLPRLSGHLPPDHPLVQYSALHGADMRTDYTTTAGSFAGLMRPDTFMDKMAVELEHRWVSRFAEHRLHLHVSTVEGEAFDIAQVYNRDANLAVELHLDLAPGRLLQMCLGYAQARAMLRCDPEHAKAWMSAGDIPLDSVLDALFPKQVPFIVHADRF